MRLLLAAVAALALVACGAQPARTDAFSGIPDANPRPMPPTEGVREGRPGPENESLFDPLSQRIQHGVAYEYSLEHCGLQSPIDVDGSFWNAVEGTRPDGTSLDLESDGEMINATPGVMAVVGDEARFRTESGSIVRLVRHDGPKAFPPCM